MIAHVLPFLIATAGISANARALPAAQGVTEFLSPGAAPDECSLSIPNTFGLSIAPVAGMTLPHGGTDGCISGRLLKSDDLVAAPLSKRQGVTQITDGQIQAPGNVGSASTAGTASAAQANAVQASAAQQEAAQQAAAQANQANAAQSNAAQSNAAQANAATQQEAAQANAAAQQEATQQEVAQVNQANATQANAAEANNAQANAAYANAATQANTAQSNAAQANAAAQKGAAQANQANAAQASIAQANTASQQQAAANNAAANTVNTASYTATGSTAGLCAGSITQIVDGQIQAPGLCSVPSVAEVPSSTPEAISSFEAPQPTPSPQTPIPQCPVSQITDGQVQAPQGCTPSAAVSSSQDVAANALLSQAGEFAAQSEVPQRTSQSVVTQIADGQVQAKRSILKVRQNGTPVVVTLDNGILTDSLGRTGYIADNRQLQFDDPPQAGAIYTAGFSACGDGTLALGGTNTFYACGSSDFNNLYDQAIYEDNCSPVNVLFD